MRRILVLVLVGTVWCLSGAFCDSRWVQETTASAAEPSRSAVPQSGTVKPADSATSPANLQAAADPQENKDTKDTKAGKDQGSKSKDGQEKESKETPSEKKTSTAPTGKTPAALDLEEPLQPLQPIKPRTPADQAKIDGLAWFAAGQILEAKNDLQGALNAYKKAVAADPQAVVAYRALINLGSSLGLQDEILKWVMKVVELDPQEVDYRRKLGLFYASRGDFNIAITLLEQALKAPGMKRESSIYVQIQGDLALLYKAVNRHVDSANSYELLLEALQNPNKFHLEFKTRAELLRDPGQLYERMGNAFLEVKRTQLAIKAYRLAAENKRGNQGGLAYNLAQVYLAADETDKALEELQSYFDAQRQSKGRAAYELLAEILKKQNKSSELMARLEAIAEKDTRNSTLHYYLADQYLAANRLEDAEKLYKKTLATEADVQGYVGLAAIYRQTNRPAELLEVLGKGFVQGEDIRTLAEEMKAISSDPKLVTALIEVARKQMKDAPGKLDFSAGYVLANITAETQQIEATVELYQYLIASRKDRAAVLYDELAQFHAENKRYPEAIKAYEEALQHPQVGERRPQLLYQLCHAQEMAGDTQGALKTIAMALQAMPDNPLLQFQEAWVYYHSQQYDEAIRKFEKIIATFTQPQFKGVVRRAQFSLSNTFVLKGEMRKGEGILEEILKENPDDPSVNNDLGYLYADQGKNLDQAEKMIRKAITAEPENGAYLDSMGWVLFKQGKFAEALPYLEKAVEKATGGDDTLWDHLGDVYDRLQQPEKALEAWKKALASARQSPRPDAKLIGRIEEKIKNHKPGKDKKE